VDGAAVARIDIREESPAEYRQVFEVERAAFGSPIQAQLVESLRATPDPSLSLIAVREAEVVGHIYFSPVTFEAGFAPAAAQLSPVAVKPSWQGQGIGSALVRAGLERCRSQAWSAVFLVGNPLFYSRFGFEMAKPLGFWCAGPHDPFLQIVQLRPNAMAGALGRVDFHPAFAELDTE
jgi:putative acetyltransferase